MPSYLFIVFIAVSALLIQSAYGDLYMQNPRGSNDRLNENGDRDNDQRLFDSQNNAAGGYCWGPELSYYEGSILSIEWTNQHSCGNDNTKCELILQYMCSDDSDTADPTQIIRDGVTTQTIQTGFSPDNGTLYYNYRNPNLGDGSTYQYGMNEPWSYWWLCQARERNLGLFTGVENVNGNNAMFTRQNAGGTRYGFECTEERDYYPYWHPSPWKDIAVLTNADECSFIQSNSQNVQAKYFCNGTTAQQLYANNERDCVTVSGTWQSVPSWGLPAPVCQDAPWNRDNHLGNGFNGVTNHYNWTLPSGGTESCINNGQCACVLRMRYNITVAEVPTTLDSTNSGYHNSPVQDDPTVQANGYNYTLAMDTAQTGRTFQDRSYMFRIIPRPSGVSSSATIYNLNVRGKRGNIVQTYPATEYDFVPTHLEVNQNDYIHFQWTGCDTNPNNNAGEGTTSTDRSNIVQIQSMNHNYPMNDSQIAAAGALFTDPTVRARMSQIDQVNCLNYSALVAKYGSLNSNGATQDTQNCFLLNAAPTPRFSGELVQMSNTGTFYYMSTRNNDFSNRSQKASIKVSSVWPVWKTAVIATTCSVGVAGGALAGSIFYAKKRPLSKIAEFYKKVPGLNKI